MNDKQKTNLTKIEKILLCIYIGYVLFTKLVYDKFLFNIFFLIIIIFITSKRKNNSTDANFLIKEKLGLIVRQFSLLCIFWNIVFGILLGELIYENSLITLIIYAMFLVISLLPFSGILKAISKVDKIHTYKNIELYRELPQKIEPAIIAYVVQDNILDKSDISATLLDLVRRNYLIIENNLNNSFDNVANGILNKKLILNPNKNFNKLKTYERFLISWFTKTSDNSNEIDMSKLKTMLKEDNNSKVNYYKWENLIKQEADKIDFYTNDSELSKFSRFSVKWAKKMFLVSAVAFLFGIILTFSEFIIKLPEIFYIIAAFLLIAHILLSALSIIIYNLRLPDEYLSNFGKENLRRWNGFVKFLKEYTMIDKRESEEVYIWEEYLVYGVAFRSSN